MLTRFIVGNFSTTNAIEPADVTVLVLVGEFVGAAFFAGGLPMDEMRLSLSGACSSVMCCGLSTGRDSGGEFLTAATGIWILDGALNEEDEELSEIALVINGKSGL